MEQSIKKKWRIRLVIVGLLFAIPYLTLLIIQLIGVRNWETFFCIRMTIVVVGIIVFGFMIAGRKRELFNASVQKRQESVKCTLINYKEDAHENNEKQENKNS